MGANFPANDMNDSQRRKVAYLDALTAGGPPMKANAYGNGRAQAPGRDVVQGGRVTAGDAEEVFSEA
jgi:hypothetical protein